jgi:Zn-dependent peptidase ImmA (M78 family)/transcriptional regulator with XRE-family HTH domain
MSFPVKGLNPEILKWARQSCGRTLEEVASSLNKEVETIIRWESGEESPTYVQLEKLAYKLYKRPLAIFFFPNPPREADPSQSFRTLPQMEMETLAPDTLFAIREAKAMQLTLLELNEGVNPSQHKILHDIVVKKNEAAGEVAAGLRTYLEVSLQEQMEWKSHDDALKRWREVVQQKGVFVFKRSFEQKDISGFCLDDALFPVIYLNNGTSFSRQIFSLFHELSHLMLKSNSISKLDFRSIEALPRQERETEYFCNKIASEFLVPSADFKERIKNQIINENSIAKLANQYKVSREVIYRKLLQLNKIGKDQYEKRRDEWNRDARRGGGKGGNYYATQAAYLGDSFIKLAFSGYYQGKYSIEQLADHLNIKAKNVPALEHFVFDRG